MAVIKIVEYYTSISTNFDAKIEFDSKVFTKHEEFLGSLKQSSSNIDLSNQSTISQDLIMKLISSLESNLKAELGPFLNFVHLMPTSSPPM